jgi:transposase-like protein
LTVTDDEREVLVRWSRRPKAPHAIAPRARIVLLAAAGMTNVAVADKVGVNQATVVKWRKRSRISQIVFLSSSENRTTPSLPIDDITVRDSRPRCVHQLRTHSVDDASAVSPKCLLEIGGRGRG